MTYFKTSLAAFLNQRHVTFQPFVYAYGPMAVRAYAIEMLMRLDRCIDEKKEFNYFLKTMHPFLMYLKKSFLG